MKGPISAVLISSDSSGSLKKCLGLAEGSSGCAEALEMSGAAASLISRFETELTIGNKLHYVSY